MLESLFGTGTKFVETTCAQCGIAFCITKTLYEARNADGKTFFCPNGHSLVYSETYAAKLNAAREKIERLQASNTEMRVGLRKTEIQLKGTKTRFRNLKVRIANGVCPCCNRQFHNLHRHMSHMHPQYKATLPENTPGA